MGFGAYAGLGSALVLLVGCPEGGGRVLGSLPRELGEGSCGIPCEEAADCPPLRDNPHTDQEDYAYRWLCLESRCVAVDCVAESDCDTFDSFGIYSPDDDLSCVQNACLLACEDEADCHGGNETCQGGFCVRQPPPPNQPRCESDEACQEDCPACVCDTSGVCLARVVCEAPSDCAGFDAAPPFLPADFECDAGACTWLGCTADADCQLVDASVGCDEVTGFCAPSCEVDLDCNDGFRFWFDYITQHSQTEQVAPMRCASGTCVFDDTCAADADCTRGRGGRCYRASNGVSYCTYRETFEGLLSPVRPPCLTGADCYEWEACVTNRCTTVPTANDGSATGRSCDDDAACAREHFAQTMVYAGLRYDTLIPSCADDCGLDTSSCGEGFSCTALPRGSDLDGVSLLRAACLPDACTGAGGCGASLATCDGDDDCPDDETCAWPVSACPGVCLATSCTACAAWLDAHTRHECFETALDVDIQIIRPD